MQVWPRQDLAFDPSGLPLEGHRQDWRAGFLDHRVAILTPRAIQGPVPRRAERTAAPTEALPVRWHHVRKADVGAPPLREVPPEILQDD